MFTGTATVNGVSGYTFMVTVEDNGNPSADRFRTQISGPGGFYYDSDAYAAYAGLLIDGSITIHKPGT